MFNARRGISSLMVLLGVGIIILIGLIVFRTSLEPDRKPKVEGKNQTRACSGKGTVIFTSPPRRLTDIGLIEPIGLMIGGHVTPIDHGYYYPPRWQPQDSPSTMRDVLSPGDGILSEVSLVGGKRGDYRLVIHHTCTFYTIYIHIKELSSKIAGQVGNITSTTPTKIAVRAGEVIGKANAFDFSVHDDEVTLKGFIVPEHYENESWKIHTVDMFNFFAEPIRSKLLAKNIRERAPRGGKIDYDIDGTLVGNWFQKGSNGYAGLSNKQGNYWKTHVAFAYDGLDPALLVVSLGDYAGEAKQFAVKGNAPDPARVGVGSGLVKYELVEINYVNKTTGQAWNRRSFMKGIKAVGESTVQGTVLVQLVAPRQMKLEVFPGKPATEVSDFTSRAQIFER